MFLSFIESRKYAHSLKLKSSTEWVKFTKSDEFPQDIPKRPEGTYKDQGWQGYSDWLGNGHGKFIIKGKGRMSFSEAKKFTRNLNLNGLNGWIAYCKSGKRPAEIPASPHTSYKREGWKGYGDWTGTGRERSISFLSFMDAKTFVHNQNLQNQTEWNSYSKSKKRPSNIPSQPDRTYKEEWKGWGDWLHESSLPFREDFDLKSNCRITYSLDQAINEIKTKYLPYEEAKHYIQRFDLKGQKEWFEFAKSDIRPKFIPNAPYQYYKEWSSFSDWLGTERVRPTVFCSFEKARKYVHSLGLKSQIGWVKFAQSGKKPEDIPAKPSKFYIQTSEWTNWNDWLGTTPSQQTDSYFVRRSSSRFQELSQIGFSVEQIISKMSEEYPTISKDKIRTRILKLSVQ